MELIVHAIESHVNLLETASDLFTKRRETLRPQLDSMSLFLEKNFQPRQSPLNGVQAALDSIKTPVDSVKPSA